jgi:ABC-2 type transport system ATP-binding protein
MLFYHLTPLHELGSLIRFQNSNLLIKFVKKTADMSIITKNISKIYGSQLALEDVSFDIGKGQIVGFIGPNGAGKSTMMKIITGYVPPTRGSVQVNNLDVLKYPLEVRRSIGYLPEHNPLYTDMYVKEYLKYVAGHYKLKKLKERIAEVIETTGLSKEQHKRIEELSKGYRQRVGLAQAIIHMPSVLILDEPTSGLDPNQIIEIRNLISELGKETTIFLSTHLMQEVEAICHRVIIINQGRIVADGNPGEITINAQTNICTILVEFNQWPKADKLKSIDGVLQIKRLKDNEILIESDRDIRQAVFQFAVGNGLSIITIQKKEKSLEEVFQELTKNG